MSSVILLPSVVFGCGIGWNEPKSHFDGVDYQGHVMQVEKLGDLDAGKGLSLPIYAVFTSHSGNNSPYAGHGWTVPLLESRMLQVDENGFKLDQPDGWFRMFGRDKDNPNILNGQGGWKAEIRGDTITAYADCGSKLVFNKGRLVSMHLKDRKFDFLYEGNRVSEIREGNLPILRVEKEAITGEVTGFRLADNRQIALERSQRPRVQVINNQNLVGGMDQSLSKITKADGTVRSIEYAVDDKLNPTMKLADRLIVWNPDSKKIIKDGEWTYDIKPGAGPFDNAAIGRKNAKNQSEFWHRDGAKGEEIVQGIDGVKKVTSWFTSGHLAGKVRFQESTSNGLVTQRRFNYDERGNLFRVTGDSLVEEFERDETGRVVKVFHNGVLKQEWRYGENSQLPVSLLKKESNSALFESLALAQSEFKNNMITFSDFESRLFDLAHLALIEHGDYEFAEQLSSMLNSRKKQFAVLIQTSSRNPNLNHAERAAKFNQLKNEFPEFNQTIQLFSNQIAHENPKTLQ